MVMTLKNSTLNSIISTFAFLIGIHHYHHLRLLPGLTMRPSKVQVKSTFNPVLLPDSLKNSTNQHFQCILHFWQISLTCHFHLQGWKIMVYTELFIGNYFPTLGLFVVRLSPASQTYPATSFHRNLKNF